MLIRTFPVAVGLALALGLTYATPVHAAMIFHEAGGIVVVEAEHFDSKLDVGAGSWTLRNNGDDGFTNARNGMFMQTLPDAGNNNNGGPFPVIDNAETMDFKINITTLGEYQMFVRAASPGGSSDSYYASILELRDGADGVADFWEFTGDSERDFDANNPTNNNGWWDGLGGLETVGAGDSDVPAVWTFSTPGEYTVRFGRREDAIAVDAFLLQRTSLTNPNELPNGGDEAELPESTQIPEPSTALLAALGLLALLGFTRRRRK